MTEVPRGRPRAEPRHEQQSRILRTARAAFTEHGYDSVTISKIAQDAAVPRAVVYDVVGSKEQLLAAVAEQVVDDLIEAVDTRFSQPADPERPLDDVVLEEIRWFVALVAAEPAFSAVMRQGQLLAIHGDDPAARARRRLESRIAELHVAPASALGFERTATAEILSVVVLALFESVAARLGDPGWPIDAVADLVGEFAAGGYVRAELSGASAAFEDLAAADIAAD